MAWQAELGSYLFGGDQVGDLLRLVDLDKVPGVVEQMQLAAGEQRGEVASDPGVEGSVPGAEDDLDRAVEAAQLRDASAAGEYRAEQVVVEPPERRPGGQELLVQLRNEPLADLGILDEPADLPGVQPPVQIRPLLDKGAGNGADDRR